MVPITELKIDDFQYIFKSLRPIDLINFSDTNKYLRSIVKTYLGTYFSKNFVIMCLEQELMTTCFAYHESLIISNFETLLRTIRIFGDHIKILTFWVAHKRKCKILGLYISTYCPNIHTILFRSLSIELAHIFNVKLNVKNVFFEFSELILNTSKLSETFPYLENLFFHDSRVANFDLFLERHSFLDYIVIDDEFMFYPFLFLHTFAKISCKIVWNDYLAERQKFIGK